MNISILAALRCEARNWWAHKDLRRSGKHAEAAARERQSIRSDLDTLRRALRDPDAYVSCGRGGTTIHTANRTLSSYGGIPHLAVARVAIALGVPFVDTRTVENPVRLIALPLVAVGRDPDPLPWGAMSYVPLSAYLRRASAMGAVIVNWPAAQTVQSPCTSK